MATIAITTSSLPVAAQKDSSGIYRTVADYQQGKLSYAINYVTERHKINDNLLFNEGEIKVKHQGMTYTLRKADTYGYRDTKGVDYRFFTNRALRMLNRRGQLLLYAYESTTGTGKGGFKRVSEYYFSKDIGGNPQLLTKENLKTAYPDAHKFHDAIDGTFKDDRDLAEYDSFHKMYKIEHLFEANTSH